MRKKTVMALVLAMVMALGPVSGQAALAAGASDSGAIATELTEEGKGEEAQDSGKSGAADAEEGAADLGAEVSPDAAAEDEKGSGEAEEESTASDQPAEEGTEQDAAKDEKGSGEAEEEGTAPDQPAEEGAEQDAAKDEKGSGEAEEESTASDQPAEEGTEQDAAKDEKGSGEAEEESTAPDQSAEEGTEQDAANSEAESGSAESGAPESAEAGAGTKEDSGVTQYMPESETKAATDVAAEDSAAENTEEEDWRPTGLRWEKGVPNWDGPTNYATVLELLRDGEVIFNQTSQSGSNDYMKKEALRHIAESGTYQFRVKFLKGETAEDSGWAESPEWVYERPGQSVNAPKGYWSDSKPGLFCFQSVEGVQEYVLKGYVLVGDTERLYQSTTRTCYSTASSIIEEDYFGTMSRYGQGKWRVQIRAISPDPEQMADGTGEFSDYYELTFGSQAPFEGASYELKYTVDTDGLTIIGYNGSVEGQLVIPEEMDGKPVIRIGPGAFRNCTWIKGDLVLPGSVKEIGSQAFEGCTGLDGKLILPEGLTKIELSAFSGCSGLSGELTLPESVTEIGGKAFSGCSGFTGALKLPEGVTEIFAGTFEGCSGFTGSLVIPEHVTGIYAGAFKGCSGFTGDLRLPSSVTWIFANAFRGCEGFSRDIYMTGNLKTISEFDYEGIEGSGFARESCTNAEITIHAPKGSAAEAYALKYGHSFVAEGTMTPDPDPSETAKGEVSSVVPESVMTAEVKAATGCDSVSELVDYLKKLIIMDKAANDILSGIPEGNSQVVDISVLVSQDGKWVEATEDTFPAEGVDILIPYPEGVDRDSFDFIVGHLIVMGCNGQIPGTVEYLKPEKTAEGLKIHVYSASPLVVAWKEADKKPEEKPNEKPEEKPVEQVSQEHQSNASVVEELKSPKTYDAGGYAASAIPWWILAIMTAPGGAIAAVAVKKPRRENERK